MYNTTSGLGAELRTKIAESIKQIPMSPARDILVELMLKVGTIDTIDKFADMMDRLWSVTTWIESHMPSPTEPERIHEVSAICRVMWDMINDAVSSVISSPNSTAGEYSKINVVAYLYLDKMILKMLEIYDYYNTSFRKNDSATFDCRGISDTYTACMGVLIRAYSNSKNERRAKYADIYKLLAKFAVDSYDMSWTELCAEIDDVYYFAGKHTIIDDESFPKEVLDVNMPSGPTINGQPSEDVTKYLERSGYPSWVQDKFHNKIEHILCPNHRAEIPENCKIWLAKTNKITSLITVPDMQTGELYAVCRCEDGIYVLFVDPDTFSQNPEHYIISGMELLDENSPAPPPRRKLRLLVPTAVKYEYVEDEL